MSREEIYELLSTWKIVPQGGPMAAIGNPFQIQSLSNCFVIQSPYDSYGGIIRTEEEMVQIMKRRGGVGFDISTIRPRGLPAANAARTTDGIGVFMEQYAATCRGVAQGGRRGALMLTISCHHPDVSIFTNIKRDKIKVTGANVSVRMSNEFMQAVKDGKQYQQRFPVEKDVPHIVEKLVDAREVWNDIVSAMRDCSEPGMLFWDTIIDKSPADCYAHLGYKTVSTNPCVTGDTKVAVADGRGSVSIQQLAEEGLDVPVYCYSNETGKMIIKLMRNPRLTGNNVPVFKVTLEGGHTFRATGNHTMVMRDGTRKRVDELLSGDQFWVAQKISAKFTEALPGHRATKSQEYLWTRDCNSRHWRTEHRQIWEFNNGTKIPKQHVIHHVDFVASNNVPHNLKSMAKNEHDIYHASLIRGDNNPIFKIKANPARFAEYSAKMSASVGGSNNPRAYDVSNDQFKQHVKKFTSEKGRRVTRNEWVKYAEANGLPRFANVWRSGDMSFFDLTVCVANELGFQNSELDARTLRTAVKARLQGYKTDIVDNVVVVERQCECCKKEFNVSYVRRECAFCSRSCANIYGNQKLNKNEARKISLQTAFAKRAIVTKKQQLDAYTQFRFKTGKNPIMKEWVKECKELNVPTRIGTKYGFTSWPELKQAAELHNHRVVSVEPCGNEDVYNGTVDDEHTFCFIVGQESLKGFKNHAELLIASEQCGEIPLPEGDSCRLLLTNLSKYVVSPFTSRAFFDYESFGTDVQRAQRLMDDLIDLEIEAIDRIITKIESDPEPEDIKYTELNEWKKIRTAAQNGRRTGLGPTALGDTFAYMNMKYGSDESIELTDKIYKCLVLNTYRASVKLAEERGAFPVFSHELERDHVFIRQIMDEDAELNEAYERFGRRNIACNTTAPAGTTSLLTQTTSGCEPVLFIKARRKRKVNPSDKNARIDEVDQIGDSWQHYNVFHHGVAKWMEVTGETDETKSPYFGSTVEDIDYIKKIDIQAAAQKWVDHSIANTTNMPKDVKVETVDQLCMHAWETGCKGVTVYRIGSRDAVVVKDEGVGEKQVTQKIVDTNAPKRPKELKCDIHRVSIKSQQYLVLIGKIEDRPYEVFAGLQDKVEVPRKFKEGVIIKNGKKDGIVTYNLQIPVGKDDVLLFKDLVNMFDNPEYGAHTRTISLALRHGVPMQYLVESLRKDKNSNMTSFSAVIARVLAKNYIPDGTKISKEACPDCGGHTLVYQMGCVSCVGGVKSDGTSCVWGKCV
jgi:ribonucleotide reductase alpha subunit